MTAPVFLPPDNAIPATARCAEMTRTPRGYERCRRDADGHQRHHVRGRSWQTGGLTPLLDLGHVCDGACCPWPEYVVPYLGTAPRQSEAAAAGLAGARVRLGRRGRKAS